MKKTLIVIACSFAMSACSGQLTKPLIPDGTDRTPINTSNIIDSYKTHTYENSVNYTERTALGRRVEALSQQVAEMKMYLAALQLSAETNQPKNQASSRTTSPVIVKQPDVLAIGKGGESIEVRGQSVVFRVTHPFGKTDFNPSPELQEHLLKAARTGKHIEIRGRTDAPIGDTINRTIAWQRASNARGFLISNGINTNKIILSYMAAGGHVTENATAEGQAKNRRVEIETMDLDATAFANVNQTKIGSIQ